MTSALFEPLYTPTGPDANDSELLGAPEVPEVCLSCGAEVCGMPINSMSETAPGRPVGYRLHDGAVYCAGCGGQR